MKGLNRWTVGAAVALFIMLLWASLFTKYKVDWTACATTLGICATTLVAVSQLKDNSEQKTKDRALETKREILIDGVRGLTLQNQAFGSLIDLGVSVHDALKFFQEGATKITVAETVAALATAKAGKSFSDILGPRFIHGIGLRMAYEKAPAEDGAQELVALRTYVLDNVIEVNRAMQRGIAAVRDDIDIASESPEDFLVAVYPNEDLLKPVIDGVLGRKPKPE